MKLEKAWRWFGKSDAVTLDHLVQMDIEGVVTALHHIPTGEVWPKEEILAVKRRLSPGECAGAWLRACPYRNR